MGALLERDGQAVLEGLCTLPGGPELLELSARLEDGELVGGAVRDLLLGRRPRELDVVVTGDAATFAQELSRRLAADSGRGTATRAGASLHERFGTASVSWPGGRIDIATRRAESYAAPGALPDVRAGTADEDLRRRDFTVNAIAITLAEPARGSVRAVPSAFDDLRHGRLRVLHARSFIDDPTRLIRLARYRARLAFEPEPETAILAEQAVAGNALASVSGARLGTELRLALTEPEPLATVRALSELGLIDALSPWFTFDEHLLRAAFDGISHDARADLVLLAALLVGEAERGGEGSRRAIRDELDRFEFPAGDRDRVLRAAIGAPALLAALERAVRPSQLLEVLGDADVEAIVLAGALGELRSARKATTAVRRWLQELRGVRLAITGDDLLAAGVPSGPQVGRLLELVLGMRLDGELGDDPGRQLDAALALAETR